MKKLLILLVTIIFVACNKENVNPNRFSDEKNIYGKWYVNNPSVWVMNISTTRITYTNGAVKEIISIDDTAVWIKNPGTYPGYVHWVYRLSIDGDTLEFKNRSTLIKFKL